MTMELHALVTINDLVYKLSDEDWDEIAAFFEKFYASYTPYDFKPVADMLSPAAKDFYCKAFGLAKPNRNTTKSSLASRKDIRINGNPTDKYFDEK